MLSHPHPFLDPQPHCHGVRPLRIVPAAAGLLPPVCSSATGGSPKPGGKFSIGSMGTACPAPLQLSQRDWKDKGAPRLNHDCLALQSQQRPLRSSNSLLPSSLNPDPPKAHSQKAKCLL